MAKEWIEQLAEGIKQRSHEAAEQYGRAQHYAGIVSAQGKEFFVALVQALQENVDGLRAQLQGDPASSETRVQTSKADEVKITRSRFPWVDARLTHHEETIALEYAKGPGVMAAGWWATRRSARLRALRLRWRPTIRSRWRTRLRSRRGSMRSRRSWRGGLRRCCLRLSGRRSPCGG